MIVPEIHQALFPQMFFFILACLHQTLKLIYFSYLLSFQYLAYFLVQPSGPNISLQGSFARFQQVLNIWSAKVFQFKLILYYLTVCIRNMSEAYLVLVTEVYIRIAPITDSTMLQHSARKIHLFLSKSFNHKSMNVTLIERLN